MVYGSHKLFKDPQSDVTIKIPSVPSIIKRHRNTESFGFAMKTVLKLLPKV
jgi:hypothetical protein